MPYVKTVWETGDLITATRLNKLEDAMADAVDDAETSLDKVTNIEFEINDNMELVVTI